MLRWALFSSVHVLSIFLAISAYAGQFPDKLIVLVDPDGRHLTLMNDFRFIDDNMRTWTAPAGTVVDGASIPRPLWSIVGGPLEGKYREASVIHDHYCETKTRPWDQVHQVFYDAMLANRVNSLQASVMYLAVYRFGPRWGVEYTLSYCPPGHFCMNNREAKYYVGDFTPPVDNKQLNEIDEKVQSFKSLDEKEFQTKIIEYKKELESSFQEDLEQYIIFKATEDPEKFLRELAPSSIAPAKGSGHRPFFWGYRLAKLDMVIAKARGWCGREIACRSGW